MREFKVCYATVTMLRILLVLSNQILTVEQLFNLSFNIISILLVRILWPKKLGGCPGLQGLVPDSRTHPLHLYTSCPVETFLSFFVGI